MALYFITGNKNKFAESQAVLPEIEMLDIDLPEIQEIDAHAIIRSKLDEARKQVKGELVVEDTSLYLKSMNGLPGPLIKWFLVTLGTEGLAKMAAAFGAEAEAKTIVGYSGGSGSVEFFEGSLKGRVVPPVGDLDFGWGPVFMPDGSEKTFGQMTREEKGAVSMRHEAFRQLKRFLETQVNE